METYFGLTDRSSNSSSELNSSSPAEVDQVIRDWPGQETCGQLESMIRTFAMTMLDVEKFNTYYPRRQDPVPLAHRFNTIVGQIQHPSKPPVYHHSVKSRFPCFFGRITLSIRSHKKFWNSRERELPPSPFVWPDPMSREFRILLSYTAHVFTLCSSTYSISVAFLYQSQIYGYRHHSKALS